MAPLVGLDEQRTGIITTDGTAYVREGDEYANWVREANGVSSLVLSGNRIGVITTGGKAQVKEGGLYAGWIGQYDGVTSLVLSGDRIGVITSDGTADDTAFVKRAASTPSSLCRTSVTADSERLPGIRTDSLSP
ncbi:hypothetical protein [Streptomyces europaeiscabiei]|uniref:hypothetical protein n=1 Tax=Streptomyces europaeiscabiei TaxID=146819 RepID=UPI002E126CD8|nr:hypothetical protein OHB30_47550 [Streptomyces europaeiscabiei]